MGDDLLRLLTLQDSSTRTVLAGAGVLGLAAGVVGALGVLRRRALVSDAVAHASLPGVCIAFLIIGERRFLPFLVGALVFGLLAAACIAWIRSATRIKPDAATALVIGGSFGLGIVLSGIIQRDPSGAQSGIDGFLFGKAASMIRGDAAAIAAVALGALALVGLLTKEFKALCFDPAFAASAGWPISLLDLTLLSLIALITVVGLPAVGVVLMVALLVIPAAAARFWTDRFGLLLVIAGAFGLASGLLGVILSAVLPPPPGAAARGWPTGPLIVLCAAAIFALSLALGARHGLLIAALRAARSPAKPPPLIHADAPSGGEKSR